MKLYKVFLLFLFIMLFNSALANDEKIILAFGDSFVAGYGLVPEESFPAQLENQLNNNGYRARVINAGVNGDSTESAKKRLQEILNIKPDIVIVSLGYNDMYQEVYADQTHSNLEYIVRVLTQSNIRVVLCGIKSPASAGDVHAKMFNPIFKDIAEAYDAEFYPYFLEGVYGDNSKTLADGVHPNSSGVKIMVTGVMPLVEKLLRQ